MSKVIVRLLRLSMLLGLLSASSFADPVHAQPPPPPSLSFPTPSKVLCSGDPPLSVTGPFTCPGSTATTTPNPVIQPYYYAITLQPNVSGPFNLLENLPLGFVITGVTCTVSAGSGTGGTTTPASSQSGQLATIGLINMVSGQTIICFVRGIFNNPGAAINTVTVANSSGNVSAPGSYSVSVNSTAILPADLSIVKTLTFPTGAPPTLNVSISPQQATYSVVIKNNGTQGVWLGPMFELVDVVSVPSTSAPLQVQLVAGSTTCTAYTPPLSTTTSCLNLIPIQSVSTWTDVTTSDLGLATWKFPTTGASAAGYIPVNGTITLTYKVEVRKHPLLYCSKGIEALHNKAFFRLTPINGVTITENTATNNTSTTLPDVIVNTGQPNDPECGLPGPGPIEITKEQVTPTLSTPVAWGGNVTYKIRVKNNDANPISINLRDYVMEWQGTPEFIAQVVSWSCTITPTTTPCIAPPVQPGAPMPLAAYYSTATVWTKPNIPVPGNGGVAEIIITINYVRTSCDSFTAGGNFIRNYARANYVWNSAPVFSEAFVTTTMAVPPPCKLEVRKKVVDIDPANVAFETPISYTVSYRNADLINPVIIGTLFDAVRLTQSNYATQLPFDATYSCSVTSGNVTGAPLAVPTSGATSGFIVHTANPAQGARIFQNSNGPITFGSNSTLTCQVVLTVHRPAPNDQYCLSSQDPRLENVGLMDVSNSYNPSLPWPPSASYNANAQFGVSQPTTLTNWQAVTVKLPKCYRLIVNKTVQPGLTWAPGGPSPLTYTIEVTNAGDTLTGSMGSNSWNGLLLGDFFLSGSPYTPIPGSVTVTSSCSSPAATWPLSSGLPAWSGAPAANLSFLPISNFPRPTISGVPCKITVQFKVAGPFTPGQICNRAGVGMPPARAPAAPTPRAGMPTIQIQHS